jgi:hypothetical protein
MIAEAAQIASLGCINKLSFAKGHEIEVFDTFLVVGKRTAAKSSFGDDFSDVLKNEIARFQICVGSQAVTFLLCLNDGDVGEEPSGESLILTF